MKMKLRAIGALVGRHFFLSFCYCFRFWFSFSFNSCLHSSSSSSLCFCVNQCSPLLLFLLISLVLVTGFLSVSTFFFFFSSLFSWLSLHSLCLFFFICVFFQFVLLLALLCHLITAKLEKWDEMTVKRKNVCKWSCAPGLEFPSSVKASRTGIENILWTNGVCLCVYYIWKGPRLT